MTFASFDRSLISLHNERISPDDALRQETAAAEILQRFTRQPGVVLADEVGMGKTFVALAVAVSVLLNKPRRPIVVMAPPALREKWPRDWRVFNEKCLAPEIRGRFRATTADRGVDFLRLLDDPPDRQNHIIFLTHGALNTSIRDGWIKLAVIKRAFKNRSSLKEQRGAFPRFAGKLLGLDHVDRKTDQLLGELLESPYESWGRRIRRAGVSTEGLADDPVPQHLAKALEDMTGGELEEVAKGLYELPIRDSDNINERLTRARRGIAEAMEGVWKAALRRAKFSSPLLILDEAHHVKNPKTRLASLFASEEAIEDSKYLTAGSLGGKFDRMLFLTATPFQLGHTELIHVLERFEGVSWRTSNAPTISRSDFKQELHKVGEALDDAQAAALRLDRAWGRLNSQDLVDWDGATIEPDDWWLGATQQEGEGPVAQAVAHVNRTRAAMQNAEQLLAPWVLRYLKPQHLAGHSGVDRRRLLPGAAILDGGSGVSGIEISDSVVLPFLLAGRAQSLLRLTEGRAFFAEGLSSSFEAYLETRSGDDAFDEDGDTATAARPSELDWYLKHVDRALPRKDEGARSAHPKIRATAERAVALWKRGEKVLIFCHFRATGRALRKHISALLHEEIVRAASLQLPGKTADQIDDTLEQLGARFFESERLRRLVTKWIRGIVDKYPNLSDSQRTDVADVVLRFIRTPSFLVRYLPLDAKELERSFIAAVNSDTELQRSLRSRIEHFIEFLSDRCTSEERADYLAALDTIQTGTHAAREVQKVFDPREISRKGRDDGSVLLPNVRLANGEVRDETRKRLLLTFNTPLFPEILIASSVLAEGVDLHLNCRYVIHHDLCWNPSTLEQRSGRVDRIGSKAERDGRSIHLYLPYIAATQDEKMFRVVRDRERWFQIIMGERYEVDEVSTDRKAERILLPRAVQEDLTMRLHP
jgi:ERCC4-related helicase